MKRNGGKNSSQGSVKAIVRIGPANWFQLQEEGEKVCFTVATEETCMMEVRGKKEPYLFSFDRIFDQNSQTVDIFKEAGIPMVDNVLAGFNSTTFAYGHWGHGKTAMLLGCVGSRDSWGLAPRMLQYLFDRIADEESDLSPRPCYRVTCSCLEIYNETIIDLLIPDNKNLQLKNDRKKGSGAYVDGLKAMKIESARDALNLIEIAMSSRTVCSTNTVPASSRSHAVVTCVVTRTVKEKDGSESVRMSQLNFVDLASSEHADASAGKDELTFKEACNINKSLSCLGRVIMQLGEAQRKEGKGHVPYRESKLTAYLQGSLEGNSRTLLVAAVSPLYSESRESLATLQFVKQVKNSKRNVKLDKIMEMDTEGLHREVLKLRRQVEHLGQEQSDGTSVQQSEEGRFDELSERAAEKLRREKKRSMTLTNQLEDVQRDIEKEQLENQFLKNKVGPLCDKKQKLQRRVNQLTRQSKGIQQKLEKAGEDSEKERRAMMEEIETHKKTMSTQKKENRERSDKIVRLRGYVSHFGMELEAELAASYDAAVELGYVESHVQQNEFRIGQLKELTEQQRAELEEKAAACDQKSKEQTERTETLKSEFKEASAQFHQELQNKDAELEAAQTTFNERLKAKDLQLSNKAKQLEAEKRQLLEAQRREIEELQVTIEQLATERNQSGHHRSQGSLEWNVEVEW